MDNKIVVRPIQKAEYEKWLLQKHYAKRLCSVSYAYGLYINKMIEGVITFGMPPSSNLAESICGKEYHKIVLELNRLITNENLPKNTLSQFVSKAIKNLPKPKIIISFADPNMNHNGYIYQATNFIYTGRSTNTEQLVDKDGKEFHFRNIGHYQKNNKLNVNLVKRRKDEEKIDKIEIAKYLKLHKADYTAKKLDKIFGYKDTSAHWFRLDSGFSFPSIDDWIKLKKLLKFDNKYDDIMTSYKLVPDVSEIIKKLKLKKKQIRGKHRYIYIFSDKRTKKQIFSKLRLKVMEYPKSINKKYENIEMGGQMLLI